MKVVIHYAGRVSQGTAMALRQEGLHHRTNDPPFRPPPLKLDVDYIECRPGHPHDYGDSLARLWAEGEGFINLEADVAPWPGALTELWDCAEEWCALPILVHGVMNERNLGCVKFSPRFIAAHPDLWSSYPRNAVFDWRSLDAWLYKRLEPALHHTHRPPALHMNPAHFID